MGICVAIMSARQELDRVAEYYQMFPQEITWSPAFTMSIVKPVIRVSNLTFESLVDTMIAQAKNGRREFLVCEHGHWDSLNAPPAAVAMKLATETTEWLRVAPMAALYDLLEKKLSASETAQAAAKIQLPEKARLRLLAKLQKLRDLDVARVEFRSCGIGGNRDWLWKLGMLLKPDEVAGPNVDHMYYLRVNPGQPFRNVNNFNDPNALHNRPGTTLFKNANTGGIFALRIEALSATSAHSFAASFTPPTNPDRWSTAIWWVDQYIMKGSSYHGGEFRLAILWPGIGGTNGAPYILPQDPYYASHIKWAGVFRL